MGSPANAAVRDYLVSQLRGLGLTPEIQRTTSAYYPLPGLLQAGTSENVLARLPGSQPGGKAFLLAAHYDSVPTGPGATDNGSGVASLLETLRALRAGPPLRNDVIFLFTDGEERGPDRRPGLRRLSIRWARDVGVVLNLDTRGNTGPALCWRPTTTAVGWSTSSPRPRPTRWRPRTASHSSNDQAASSDLSVFLDAGWAGLQVSSTGGISHYHGAAGQRGGAGPTQPAAPGLLRPRPHPALRLGQP